jgi:DNA polymerase-3 subunit beta
MNLNIKARLVAAIAQFKASNDIRYYLNGVYVEPRPQGGVVIVATNGHAIGAWLDISGEIDRPAILRIGAKLQAACHGSDVKRLIIADDRLAVVDDKSTELYVQPEPGKWEVPGKFPDYKTVFKPVGGPPSLNAALNPEYIAAIDRALTIGASAKYKNVTTRQAIANDAITFTSTAAAEFVAVVMPVRESEAPYPEWLKSLQIPSDMKRRAAAAPLPVHEPSDAGPRDDDWKAWDKVRSGAPA